MEGKGIIPHVQIKTVRVILTQPYYLIKVGQYRVDNSYVYPTQLDEYDIMVPVFSHGELCHGAPIVVRKEKAIFLLYNWRNEPEKFLVELKTLLKTGQITEDVSAELRKGMHTAVKGKVVKKEYFLKNSPEKVEISRRSFGSSVLLVRREIFSSFNSFTEEETQKLQWDVNPEQLSMFEKEFGVFAWEQNVCKFQNLAGRRMVTTMYHHSEVFQRAYSPAWKKTRRKEFLRRRIL